MIYKAISKNEITIRLTDERWSHITEEHCELAGMKLEILEAVEDPSHILAGKYGEMLAVKRYDEHKYLVVVYRENINDGFVITAFLTSRKPFLGKRKLLWSS